MLPSWRARHLRRWGGWHLRHWEFQCGADLTYTSDSYHIVTRKNRQVEKNTVQIPTFFLSSEYYRYGEPYMLTCFDPYNCHSNDQSHVSHVMPVISRVWLLGNGISPLILGAKMLWLAWLNFRLAYADPIAMYVEDPVSSHLLRL